MNRESDDNTSSNNTAFTDLYQETVRRFTRSSLSSSPDLENLIATTTRRQSLRSPTPSSSTSTSTRTRTMQIDRSTNGNERGSSYDNYLEATGRRRSSDHGAVLTADTEQFIIGQRVWVGGIRPGQIAFLGETHFAPGEWAGIVLDEPNGKNDGCVAGKRYFQCEPRRGIFSRLTRLTMLPLAGAQASKSPLAKNSPERSRTVSPTTSVRSSMLRSPGASSGKSGFTVGDRVIVSSGFGSRPGVLRYLGETQFAPGNWCGVELDEPSGKNDGAVDGIRYFECKPKYGVFVPIAKVSLSPTAKKTRLSRCSSRESLTSIGTMNSIATTNTSRLRMNAQRKSSVSNYKPITTPKAQFSMQDILRERQHHIEQLMIERDLDREDAQNQALQQQKNINEVIIFTDTFYAPLSSLSSSLGQQRQRQRQRRSFTSLLYPQRWLPIATTKTTTTTKKMQRPVYNAGGNLTLKTTTTSTTTSTEAATAAAATRRTAAGLFDLLSAKRCAKPNSPANKTKKQTQSGSDKTDAPKKVSFADKKNLFPLTA